jgi:CRISPR/Cas system-associated exonuclease Cas4 (RecB family)
MADNLRDFHSRYTISPEEIYQDPEITWVSVSSTVGEVHEVHRILSNIIPNDCQDLTRTAVVLPDEQLLIPLLNAFPESVSKINVTMGYPLRSTSLYMPVAYPEQYLDAIPNSATAFITQMRDYLLAQRNEENAEGVYQLTKVLDRLETATTTYPQIAFSVTDMQQLLKMLTMECSIPYVGEPLDGLQVMGVLETRALAFDNIIIADFNDDLYPGRSRSNSFIPYALRAGFNMPTIDRQNAIFAYNFYRMLSYAKHVWFITNSTADEQHSGEVSRYLYQLKWQYNVNIHEVVVTNQLVTPKQTISEKIAKDQRINQLQVLSASALTTYLSCPKKFYYQHIEHLQEPNPDETISASDKTLGIVLHAIIEELYQPGQNITASTIEQILHQINEDTFWASLKPLKMLNGDLLAERVVRTYVNNILQYDAVQAPFQFVAAEEKVSVRLPEFNLLLKGTVDRIDTHGKITRIIDYKTGKSEIEYSSMEDVFGVVPPTEDGGYTPRKKGKSQILQTLLYCWILSERYPNMVPHIYATRRLADTETMTWVHRKDSEQALVFDEKIKQEFEDELHKLIAEILDQEIPFCSTQESRMCESCAFAILCGK